MPPDALSLCPVCGQALISLDEKGSIACAHCCEELLVLARTDGVREYRTFDGGVVGGGITIIDRDGGRSLLSGPSRVWPVPLVLTVISALIALVLVLIGGWLIAALVFTGALSIPAAAAIMLAKRRRTKLVIDARGLCTVEKSGRVVLRASVDAIRNVSVRVVAPPSYSDCHEVLLSFDGARVRVAQRDEQRDAAELARQLAERAGVTHEPTVERDTPHG